MKINQHLQIVNLFFDIIFVMYTLIIAVARVPDMLNIHQYRRKNSLIDEIVDECLLNKSAFQK